MSASTRFDHMMLNRRQALKGFGAIAGALAFGLSGCSDEDAPMPAGSGSTGSADPNDSEAGSIVQLDVDAYDDILSQGPVADAVTISASSWASKVKDSGTLRYGGDYSNELFALTSDKDGVTRGFDAGIARLLARYILGDENAIELTQVTADTRESVIENDQVDTVVCTYSITDERKKVVSFAGPYYTTQQGIMVQKDNEDINSVDDLAGKNVAAQSGSTGPSLLEQYAPECNIQEFKTIEEAEQALRLGRVDAFVIDQTILMSGVVQFPNQFRLVDDAFGPVDSYGIGLPLDSDGVAFVNGFLQEIEDAGAWSDLWKVCIGERADISEAPEPPAIDA